MSQEPFDKNDIDNALHEIHQMVLVALEAVAALVRLDDDPVFFNCRRRVLKYFPSACTTCTGGLPN